jgi:hypothetical protein
VFSNSALITKTASAYQLSMAVNGVTLSPGSTVAAGTVIQVTARMVDGAGNFVTNVTGGTVSWGTTGSGSSFSSGTSTVLNGVAVVNFTTGSTGHTITVTDTRYSPSITGSTTTGAGTAPTGYVVTTSNNAAGIGETITLTAQLVNGSTPLSYSGRTVNWSATTDGVAVTTNSDAALGTFSALTSTTNSSGVATISFTVSSQGYKLHTIKATDATSATPACSGSPCTGTSENIETGVALIGAPATVPANAQRDELTFAYPVHPVTLASRVRAGDLIIVSLNLSNSGGGDPSTASVTNAGWTIAQRTNNIATQLSMIVLYRVATGSETGNLTINISNSQRVGGAMMIYRNVDTSSPFHGATVTNQTTPQTGTAPFSMTAAATTTPNHQFSRVLMFFENGASGSNRITLPSGTAMLYRYDGSNQSGGQYTVIAGAQTHQNAAAATVPAATATNTYPAGFIATQFILKYKP